MKRTLKIISTFLLAAILVVLLQINMTLYYEPDVSQVDSSIANHDLLKQLRYLKVQKNDAGYDMQKLYPEGYVFFNAIYGLAWRELADSVNLPSLYKEAHDEISAACLNVQSEEAKSTFQELLSLPYGAFYCGWSNYLLGTKLAVEPVHKRSTKEIEDFKKMCDQIADVVRAKETPYPVSYYRGAWPADAMVCIASLALHDRLFPPVYQNTIAIWLEKVKANLDENGLIPHSVNPASDKSSEAARGSSQSLMLIFLNDIDPEFAKQQFIIYKEKFLDYRLGLPGIREYPKGTSGLGDVDSGPVIFQIGAAASIVGIRTMALYGEHSISAAMRNSIEAFAVPLESDRTKKYLFGQLPIADAFIAWADTGNPASLKTATGSTTWRTHFHWYSILIATPIITLIILLWVIKPREKKRPLIIDW